MWVVIMCTGITLMAWIFFNMATMDWINTGENWALPGVSLLAAIICTIFLLQVVIPAIPVLIH